jgi:hypothetical protein
MAAPHFPVEEEIASGIEKNFLFEDPGMGREVGEERL